MFAHVTNTPLPRPPSHPCFLPGSLRKHVKASRRNERREREEGGTPTAFVIVASKCDVPKRTDDADADDGEEDEKRT